MKHPYFILFLIGSLAIMASCKKEKTLQDELAKLPPATQTGANSFGCLVNGKAWVAQSDCYFICDPSFKMYYDVGYGGNFFIDAVWLDSKKKIDQAIELWFDSSNITLNHELSIQKKMTGARFVNYNSYSNCGDYERYSDSLVIYSGEVNINKYDLSSGIISGTFEFTLSKPGCDTLKVTNGRFDKKL